MVVRPGLRSDPDPATQSNSDAIFRRLTEAGADKVAVSLAEARTQIAQMLLPVLAQSAEPDSAVGALQLAESPA